MTADAFSATAGPAPSLELTADVYDRRAFGFWVYLMSDAIIFSLLFATYAVMLTGTDGGPTGQTLFSLPRASAKPYCCCSAASPSALPPWR